MDSFKDVLEAAQAYCKTQMAEPTYNLYIDGLEPISFEDSSHITLSVRNDFICKIVTDRYLGLLKEAFKTVLGFDVDITLVVPSTPPHEVVLAQQYEANPASPQGNYEFTFENFIKGPSNQFAFAAAQAVAANPSGAYNPLFIYGGSGLGKTHLLTAIQTEIKRTHPDFVIMYVTCEQFTNELIAAIRAGSTEDFRMKYRVADLLLVDDIQFIAGKESTQEEFFHTFNSLHDAHKQIVIASDRPAKEIKSLEERLRTRFEWGLTADVQPPDFETRVAIVKRKAELLHLDLPEDVAEFIANHLKNNIRQLEGAVKKLNAYYMLEGIQPVISVAQNAIKDILNETQPVPVTIEKIVGEVSRTFNVSPADIRGTKRNANVASARRVAIYILREVTGMSMEEIGREFSGRDHSTIVYSLKTMERDMKNDQHLRETVSDIIKNVKALRENRGKSHTLAGDKTPNMGRNAGESGKTEQDIVFRRQSSPLFPPSFQHSTSVLHTRRGKKSSSSPFHKPFTLHSQSGGKPRSRTIPHIFRLFHIFPSPYYEYYNKFNIDLEVLSLFYGRKNLKT